MVKKNKSSQPGIRFPELGCHCYGDKCFLCQARIVMEESGIFRDARNFCVHTTTNKEQDWQTQIDVQAQNLLERGSKSTSVNKHCFPIDDSDRRCCLFDIPKTLGEFKFWDSGLCCVIFALRDCDAKHTQ
jgi:hypothetical protein